jgi:hypothetical protein
VRNLGGSGRLAFDIQAVGACALDTTGGGASNLARSAEISINATTEHDLTSLTQSYEPNAMVIAFAAVMAFLPGAYNVKLRLYIDGSLVDESAALTNTVAFYTLKGYKQVSGSKVVKLCIYNYDGVARSYYIGGVNTTVGGLDCAQILAGSVKRL